MGRAEKIASKAWRRVSLATCSSGETIDPAGKIAGAVGEERLAEILAGEER